MIRYVEQFRTPFFYMFATSVCTSRCASINTPSSFLRELRAIFSTPDLFFDNRSRFSAILLRIKLQSKLFAMIIFLHNASSTSYVKSGDGIQEQELGSNWRLSQRNVLNVTPGFLYLAADIAGT